MIYSSSSRSKYRSRTEIVIQILEAVNDHDEYGDGVTQSTIRYEAFLSSTQLREYLAALTIHGLLSYDSVTHRYNTTEKGLRYLDFYYKIADMTKEGQLLLLLQQQEQQPKGA